MSRALLAIVAGLDEEHEIAPPAALLSDARQHYDREVGRLLLAGEQARIAIPALIARAGEAREVRRVEPPHFPLEGGYGRPFGHVTVGDKARFCLARLLGEALAKQAVSQGAAWWRLQGPRLRWDPKQGRFVP